MYISWTAEEERLAEQALRELERQDPAQICPCCLEESKAVTRTGWCPRCENTVELTEQRLGWARTREVRRDEIRTAMLAASMSVRESFRDFCVDQAQAGQ